jgi:hypothetical protein
MDTTFLHLIRKRFLRKAHPPMRSVNSYCYEMTISFIVLTMLSSRREKADIYTHTRGTRARAGASEGGKVTNYFIECANRFRTNIILLLLYQVII